MADELKKFYGSLAGDTYLREIRRFGLRYDEMVDVSRERLAGYKGIEIICENIRHYNPSQKYDVIFSNLAIHNLANPDKLKLLRRIKDWLKPGGTFVWGGFMDWHDKKVDRHFMNYRRSAVMTSEVDKEFAEKNFCQGR